MGLTCFIISPLGIEESDWVQQELITPACGDDFEIVRSDEVTMISQEQEPQDPKKQNTIPERIFNNLRNADIVVAYLGSPQRGEGEDEKWYWNANVMFEAGYRMGLGRPILFVRDKRVSDAEPFLPFDIQHYETIELPADQRNARILREARERIKKKCDECVVDVDPGPPGVIIAATPIIAFAFDGSGGSVTGASAEAEELFGIEPLFGVDINDLLGKIESMMPKKQARAFMNEQNQMLGELLRGQKPRAGVCLVFSDQDLSPKDEIPHAWLPVITSFDINVRPWDVRVVYFEVGKRATLDDDGVVRFHRR